MTSSELLDWLMLSLQIILGVFVGLLTIVLILFAILTVSAILL